MAHPSRGGGGGCRFGIGGILLFSLSTNAYLIFLFHQTTGRDTSWIAGPSQHQQRTRERDLQQARADDPFWAPRAGDVAGRGRSGRRRHRGANKADIGGNSYLLRRRIKSTVGAGVELAVNDDDGTPAEEEDLLSQDGGEASEESGNVGVILIDPEGQQQSPKRHSSKDGARDVNAIDGEKSPAEEDALGKEKKRLSGNVVWPKPEGWETMGFYDTRLHFDCSKYAHNQSKKLPSVKDWQFLRDRYRAVVDSSATFDDPVPPTEGYTFGEGGPPPYYAAHSKDGRGRGLFASRDIKKGDLVHNGEQSDLLVPSGEAWRRFVFSLPRNKACDVIDWTWTAKTEEKGKWKIFTAMNISILLNGAESSQWNVNPKSSTSSLMYALRDIRKGEELLTDYEMYDTVWHKVGLGSEDDDASYDDGDDDAEEEKEGEEKEEEKGPVAETDEKKPSRGSEDDTNESDAEVPPEKESQSPGGEPSKSGEGGDEVERSPKKEMPDDAGDGGTNLSGDDANVVESKLRAKTGARAGEPSADQKERSPEISDKL
ncbi:hypothetical protein ACHAXT_012750 [Thalassiosira profunda]